MNHIKTFETKKKSHFDKYDDYLFKKFDCGGNLLKTKITEFYNDIFVLSIEYHKIITNDDYVLLTENLKNIKYESISLKVRSFGILVEIYNIDKEIFSEIDLAIKAETYNI